MNMHFTTTTIPAYVSVPHCDIEFSVPLMFRGVKIGEFECAVTVADDLANGFELVEYAVEDMDNPGKWIALRYGDKLHRTMDDDLKDSIDRAFDKDDDAQSEAAEKIAEFIASYREERRA